jgi:hypothetical protein
MAVNLTAGNLYPLSLVFRNAAGETMEWPDYLAISWQVISTGIEPLGDIIVDAVDQRQAFFQAGSINATGYLQVVVEGEGYQPLCGRNADDLIVAE